MLAELETKYPQTVQHFRQMNALDHLERVVRLEQNWQQVMYGAYQKDSYEQLERFPASLSDAVSATYDLIYAGGGLGLIHATVMAMHYGQRVLIFDYGEIGQAHREWNISRAELQAFVDIGIVTWAELSAVVMREYRNGLVRFYNSQNPQEPKDLWLPEVLNVALDANALLGLMRQKFLAAGGTILSQHGFQKLWASQKRTDGVIVELRPRNGEPNKRYKARLLIDAMGSTSPLALFRHAGQPFAGVCPTVGTVASGFMQGAQDGAYQPDLGDILISVDDAEGDQQLLWEGFPGRGDELTVYLFYYATIKDQDEQHSLLELFERYFSLLPDYKQPGPDFKHHKPVYGYIPARHSLQHQEAPLLLGVLPIGDSAAQQSPLTFCGFGSHIRNLQRTTSLLNYALRHTLLAPDQLAQINAFQANVSLNWVFSRFMQPWRDKGDVNRLQNIFLDVLEERGEAMATRFFQDRMRWSDYHPLVLGVLWRYYAILPIAYKVLGIRGMLRWGADYLQFCAVAVQAALARRLGRQGEFSLTRLAEHLSPRLGLRLRAQYAEWRAMGWLSAER